MTICFIILFILIIINSLMVILTKNPVTSVLHLIVVFILTTINLIFLDAEFLAILIIIIYIGAISILFLFVIMMLNLRILEVYSSLINIFPIASFLAMFLFSLLIYMIKKDYYILYYIYNNYFSSNIINNSLVDSKSNLFIIGDILFNHYSILVIIIGLILLLAMLGAIILTRNSPSKNIFSTRKNIFTMNKITKVTFWGIKK